MNLIFNKKTHKVIALLDNVIVNPEAFLKSTFPNQYNELSLWTIDKMPIYNNVLYLKVELDKFEMPDKLLCGNKVIYKCSNEDKQKMQEAKIKEKERYLLKVLPRNLIRSLYNGVIKMWSSSPYTNINVAESLKNMDYFFESKTIPIAWWGMFTNAGGYANMNRSFVYRLHNHHIIPRLENVPSITQISSWGQYYIHKLSSLDFRRIRRYSKIYGFGPQPQPPHNGARIFYTMMETETLHPTFRDLCNLYSDEVWVPSIHNKIVFEKYGIKKPIYLMPLGIDENVYKNIDSSKTGIIDNPSSLVHISGRPIKDGINKFRFFTLFGRSYRKGIDILIRSFIRAFNSSDDVVLIIASTHVGPDTIRADVKKYGKQVRSDNYPQILFYPHVTQEQDMPKVYKMGHAFLYTSRGEGFGLTPIEASACGLPIISTNNTGMSEYLTDDNAYLIKNSQQEMCSPEMHCISPFYHGQMFPKLGENQILQTIKHMYYVINNYKDAQNKAKLLRDLIYSKYTWNVATERIAKRIMEIH